MKRTIGALSILLFLAACGDTSNDDAAGSDQRAGAEEDTEDNGELIPIRWGVAVSAIGSAQAHYSALPLALGYWEDEGLDVEVLGFAGSGAVAQALDAGQIEAGTITPGPLFPAVAAGSDFVAYYDVVSRNYLIPGVVEDSDIQDVGDFPGKTIGVQSLESGAVPMIQMMLAHEDLDADSVDFVAIGTGAEAYSFIEQDRVDVVGLWDSARAEIEERGIPLREVAGEEMRELGFQYPVVSTHEMLNEQRDVLVGLGRGVAKASVFALENPEAAARIVWEVYPESKPVGVPDDEALAQSVRVMQARWENSQPIDGLWGNVADGAAQTQMELMLKAGLIDEEVSLEDLWTDELLAEINDFEEEAVREAARTWSE